MSKDTLYLQLRGNVWTYVRRVPSHLVQTIGCRFIKKSLGVSDKASAKKMRAFEEARVNALFSEAEKQLAGAAASEQVQLSTVSSERVMELVRHYVEAKDLRSKSELTAHPIQNADERTELLEDADEEVGIFRTPDDPRCDQSIYGAKNAIARNAGVSEDAIGPQGVELIRRGLIELARRRSDRYQDDFSGRHYDELFAPGAQESACTFGELVDAYVAEKFAEYEKNGTSKKRVEKVAGILDTIRQIVGAGTLVRLIDDDIVQMVRHTLAEVPKNRTKIFKNHTLVEAIQRAKATKVPCLGPLSQRQYIAEFKHLMAFAARKRHVSFNPADGLKPLVKDTVPLGKKRFPWSDDQLKGFFEGEFYRQCATDKPEPYSKKDRAWRYWLPLLMLFSGARPNELCQLHVSDVKKTNAGTWYMDISEDVDEEEDGDKPKSLKTETSRRRIPIHAQLIALGFLKFVEERRKAAPPNDQRLFREFKPNKHGNLAWYPAKRFREKYIPDEIQLGPRQTFYSLRHNFRDALRRCKAPSDVLLAVAGWSQGGANVSDHYGDPGNPDLTIGWVNEVTYPGLDLSFLCAGNQDEKYEVPNQA